MGSFLAFQADKDRELAPAGLRNSFIACGMPCVLDGNDGSAFTISFEPTANVLFLKVEEGRVASVEFASDGGERSRLPDAIIEVLHRGGYEFWDRDQEG